MTVHVVVIGAGVAGCMTAVAARRAGASVTVVSRSAGSTALCTGAVSLDGTTGAAVDEASRRISIDALCEAGGLARSGGAFMLSTGAVMTGDLVATNHLAGALGHLEGKSVLVAGIPGLASVNAPDIARRLVERGIRAMPASIPIDGLRRTFELTAFPVARAMDEADLIGSWARAVGARVAADGFDVVALPPVMGLQAHEAGRRILQSELGVPWFELLGAPPTVPGMRLWQDLQRYMSNNGVTLLHADVKHAVIKADCIVQLRAWDGEVVHELFPDQVVLATGRFVTGGIVLEGRLVEALLDLPVYGREDDERSRLEAGVLADSDHRAVTEAGEVVIENVRVAGAVRAGGSYATGTAGIGLAAVTGWAAGTRAALSVVEIDHHAARRTVQAIPRPGGEGCLGCEMCASVCPVLSQAIKDGPWYPGPRGLSSLVRSGPLLRAAGDPLSLCTLCAACSTVCPAGGRNHETVAWLRARLIESSPDDAPEPHRAMPRVIETSGNVYGEKLEPLFGPRREDAELAFFPGCSLSYFERESASRTIRLLESLGLPLSIVDGVCCGGPLDVIGLDPTARAVQANRQAVARTGARIVVATCPRCVHRLAHDLDLPGVTVEHTLTLLDRLLPGSQVLEKLRSGLAGRTVTYHDPCEMGRYLGRYDEARRVLALVGVRIVEMASTRERSACCGAGGGLRAVDSRLSREISRRRVTQADETGADYLLTECPSCLHNLRTGKKRKQAIGVDDLTSFFGSVL